ncbi:very short patch repair endonuclease [Sorangium atrum]|uniref:Very short patch repair endonuclease n=1 Tax=Sorangium atrum TaxID=2995308 RepID=A0ABT5C9J0_9BACT|nr:very short patch repair endonuclease [Sorangium aterium]MDC0682623.1 very short patch repair endonuclease [Sorangium aterium]
MADNMTPEQRRRTMSRIRKTDTKPELIIRRLSFARGLRYRKYVRHLPGKPDLVFAKARVVVFVDGDFWHGWRFDEWEAKLTSPYWKEKIRRNRARDREHDATLEANGWTVLRIWEHEVEADADACVDWIERAVRAQVVRQRTRETRASR